MREALTDCQLTFSIAMIKDTDKDTAKVQNGKAILYSKVCNQLFIQTWQLITEQSSVITLPAGYSP